MTVASSKRTRCRRFAGDQMRPAPSLFLQGKRLSLIEQQFLHLWKIVCNSSIPREGHSEGGVCVTTILGRIWIGRNMGKPIKRRQIFGNRVLFSAPSDEIPGMLS